MSGLACKSIMEITALLFAVAAQTAAAEGQELPLRSRLQPVSKNSGLRMDGYFVWCGSVIKVGNTYHMFASRWPEATQFPQGYRTHSEIVRATAGSPEGPYSFQEVVIGKRTPGKWDSGMAHNPALYQVGEQFVLFYNASEEGKLYRHIGCATAPAVTGPWIRSDAPLDLGIQTDANNPAACFSPDGSVKLIWRDFHLRIRISVAASFRGPYRVANDNVWPKGQVEDFFLFMDRGEYHLICEDSAGTITGHKKWGAHLCSNDGIHDWKPYVSGTAYNHDIRWSDGSEFHAVRRERPWLLVEDGTATCLFTAVYDGQRTWSQPVPIRPCFLLQR